MREPFTIEQPVAPLSFRLPLLIAGILLLAFGLLGLTRGSAILLAGFTGQTPWPPHFLQGWLLTLTATGLGTAMIWPNFIPDRKTVFDAASGQVRHTERYPFGFCRETVFAFSAVPAPEVLWHRDEEYSSGGYWALKVTLPDGRSVSRAPDAVHPPDQKAQAEAWLAEILRMRR